MTLSPRRPPTKDERIAACLLEIKRGDGTPIVTREEAKHLTARECYETFMERVDIDHIVPRGIDGPDHHANYQPLAKATDHKPKTAKDKGVIAKAKRIRSAHQEHQAAMAVKKMLAPSVAKTHTGPKRKWPTRQIPGSKASGLRKRMNGSVDRR